jgi:hypothetical protein
MPDIPPLSPSAVEFVYGFDGATFTLEQRTDVVAIAPADIGPVAPGTKPAGFWCEVRDGGGTTLWRTIVRHPTRSRSEVMLDDDSFGYELIPPSGPAVAFAILVPGDLAGAQAVALVGTDPLDETGAAPTDVLVHAFAAPVA